MKKAALMTLIMLLIWPCSMTFAGDEIIPLIAEYAMPAVVNIQSGSGSGSGFIISPAGFILTNAHVVKGANSVTVTFADGKIQQAAVIDSQQPDVALLKLETIGLPSLRIGSSKTIKQGETILMLGSPRGLANTVSRGIVSNTGRENNGVNYIQLDVAINPGNSGGPILNLRGEVIGIATMMLKDSQGIGFVLPIEAAFSVLKTHNVPADTIMTNADIALQPPLAREVMPVSSADTNWYYIAAAVGVIALMGGAIFVWQRRRKRAESSIDLILRPKEPERDLDIDLH